MLLPLRPIGEASSTTNTFLWNNKRVSPLLVEEAAAACLFAPACTRESFTALLLIWFYSCFLTYIPLSLKFSLSLSLPEMTLSLSLSLSLSV